jgi:hypothetical protein
MGESWEDYNSRQERHFLALDRELARRRRAAAIYGVLTVALGAAAVVCLCLTTWLFLVRVLP